MRSTRGGARGGARALALAALAVAAMATGPCRVAVGAGSPFLAFTSPAEGQLSATGALAFELGWLLGSPRPETLEIRVDGAPVEPEAVEKSGRRITGRIPDPGPGWHRIEARVESELLPPFAHLGAIREAETRVQLAELERPEHCELLNQAECLLPYPSSRYLAPADTPTGVRLDLPQAAMPRIAHLPPHTDRLDPAPYNRLDGFSPTVQVLMSFPQGVDLEASDAPRLREDRRTFGERSLEPGSPSVLIEAETGRRIAHFLENDARASDPRRRITFLRPAESLLPGRRYLVALRDLTDPDGDPVEAEPAFAALRDRRPSDVPALRERRPGMEALFRELERHGLAREELVLAFDFAVQSDEGLTSQMLAMRDEAFDWLEEKAAEPGGLGQLVAVDEDGSRVVTPAEECPADPDAVWRFVEGTFQAPLFLAEALPLSQPLDPAKPADPIARPTTPGFLAVDAEGRPVRTGTVEAPFGLALPCRVLTEGPAPPLVVGHGLFGNGPDTVEGLAEEVSAELARLEGEGLVAPDLRFDYAAAGTNWSGLSSPDIEAQFPFPFVQRLFINFDLFPMLPDRLRQGQLQTLVLARLLTQGAFNELPALTEPAGGPVVAEGGPGFYFGASLGGIMGLMFAALSPDVERLNVDVPAINFSLLLQRAKPFKAFQEALSRIAPDPTVQALGLQVIHELWVRGESAGYAHHVTGNTLAPLEGTNEKKVLMTVARFDQQVRPLAAQIAAATLGIPNLVPGSVREDLPLLPDVGGPVESAHVVYDTGSYELGADDAFIPPLANLPPPVDDDECDPHGLRAFIPASLEQLFRFLRPGGVIENFCDGACDAAGPLELPRGMAAPCEPGSAGG